MHLWLGLSSGLVVFMLGLTGCFLAFEYEIKDILYKDKYTTTPQQTAPLPVSTLLPIAEKAAGHPIDGVTISSQPGKTFMFTASHFGESWNYFNAIPYSYTVFVDPYNGQVKGVENSKLEFFRLVLMLHYDLFLESTGKKIIGWSTVIFIVMLITGLVLWWPKNKAAAKQRFWFRWKKGTTKWKRKNYDLHNIFGFYAMIFALIIAMTGLVWAFRWFDNSVQWVANGGAATPPEKEFYSDTLHPNKQADIFDKVLTDMKARDGKADSYYVGIPEDNKSVIYGYSEKEDDGYKWTSYNYDQYSGKNLEVKYFKDKVAGEKLRNMNYYIHTGAVWGMPGKILAFFISFICAGLPITGFYIWWGRKKKKVLSSPNARK